MTDMDKTKIIRMKAEGESFRSISKLLGISESTIKSFYSKNQDYCPTCGKPVNGKKKKFCSDKCRMWWWRKHAHRTDSMKEYACPICEKKFYAYESKKRKYCSKKCYGKSCRKGYKNDERKAAANIGV